MGGVGVGWDSGLTLAGSGTASFRTRPHKTPSLSSPGAIVIGFTVCESNDLNGRQGGKSDGDFAASSQVHASLISRWWQSARRHASYGQIPAAAPCNVRFQNPDPFGRIKFTRASGKPAAQMSDFLASDPSGWVDIMPHETFQGWTRVPIPPGKTLDPVNQWSLRQRTWNNSLCEGNHGHEWLRYDHELTQLSTPYVEMARFEKRDRGLKGYNSGIFVRNDLEGRVWHQAQVGAAAFIFGQTLIHGELSPIIKTPPPAVNPLHPVGEWNTYEIRCDGPKITLWVNGDSDQVSFRRPRFRKAFGAWKRKAIGSSSATSS